MSSNSKRNVDFSEFQLVTTSFNIETYSIFHVFLATNVFTNEMSKKNVNVEFHKLCNNFQTENPWAICVPTSTAGALRHPWLETEPVCNSYSNVPIK